MIYTCTLNPSIDYHLKLDQLKIGELNRSLVYDYRAGGKGINVSIVLNNIGISSTLLGFFGGYQGQALLEELTAYPSIRLWPTMIKGMTRINIKIKAEEETEINAGPPAVKLEEGQDFLNMLHDLNSKDVVILSGSSVKIPSLDLYEAIALKVSKAQAKLIVDTTGPQLLSLLKYKPFLIKPNEHEMEELFNKKLSNEKELILAAKSLCDQGAENVIVSRGGKGSILVNKNSVYEVNAPKGRVIGTVGAGDSMVAGFIGKYLETNNLIEAIKFATACGSATAFSPQLAVRQQIDKLLPEIHVTKMEG